MKATVPERLGNSLWRILCHLHRMNTENMEGQCVINRTQTKINRWPYTDSYLFSYLIKNMKWPQTLQTASESTNLHLKYRLSSRCRANGAWLCTQGHGEKLCFSREKAWCSYSCASLQARNSSSLLVTDISYRKKGNTSATPRTALSWPSEQSGVGWDKVAELRCCGHCRNLGSCMSESLWAATGTVKACKAFWDPLRKYYV